MTQSWGRPIQMLEDEHLVIAKVVGAASVLADRQEAGKAIDKEILHGIGLTALFWDKTASRNAHTLLHN